MRSKPLAAVLLLCLPLVSCKKTNAPAPNEHGSASEVQPVKGVDFSHKGQPASGVTFAGPDGKQTRLANFAGRPLLVNLWATWCAPCVKELPTLDRLAGANEGEGALRVLAVSQDFGPHASVVAFLQKNRIAKLAAYQDAKSNLSSGLGAEVLPTSILFDARGREVWRYVGDLDWTSSQAAKLLSQAEETQQH